MRFQILRAQKSLYCWASVLADAPSYGKIKKKIKSQTKAHTWYTVCRLKASFDVDNEVCLSQTFYDSLYNEV